MKMKRNSLTSVIMLICVTVLSLSGCTIKTPGDGAIVRIEKNFEAGQLFYLEEELCTTAEARIFLMNQKNLYTNRYGEEIWNATYEGEPLYSYLEDNLRDFMVRLKCMVLMAAANEVSLSADDQRLITLAANEYYATLSEAELAYSKATKQDIVDAFSDYFLANKLYRVLTQDATKEISLDEARVITVQMIYLPFDKIIEDNTELPDETGAADDTEAADITGSVDDTDTDGAAGSVDDADTDRADNSAGDTASTGADTSANDTSPADGDNSADANYQLIKELHKRVTQGEEDFYTLAETYSRGEWIENRICRGEMEEAFETAAFSLSSGAISKVITGEDGYYIIKCLNNHEEELTQAHREEMIEEWKQDIFKEKYDAYVQGLYLRFNEPEWITLDFSTPAPDDNDSFYSVYDEFLSGSE